VAEGMRHGGDSGGGQERDQGGEKQDHGIEKEKQDLAGTDKDLNDSHNPKSGSKVTGHTNASKTPPKYVSKYYDLDPMLPTRVHVTIGVRRAEGALISGAVSF
jgi:hypothetical protein